MSFFDFPIYQPAQDHLASTESPLPTGPIGIYVNEGEYKDTEQALLAKIIGATKKSLNDIPVKILRPNDSLSLQQTWDSKKGIDIIFGVQRDQLMLQCEVHLYYPITVDHRKLLFCDSLTVLNTDGEKKKALWGCLKEHFNI